MVLLGRASGIKSVPKSKYGDPSTVVTPLGNKEAAESTHNHYKILLDFTYSVMNYSG